MTSRAEPTADMAADHLRAGGGGRERPSSGREPLHGAEAHVRAH